MKPTKLLLLSFSGILIALSACKGNDIKDSSSSQVNDDTASSNNSSSQDTAPDLPIVAHDADPNLSLLRKAVLAMSKAKGAGSETKTFKMKLEGEVGDGEASEKEKWDANLSAEKIIMASANNGLTGESRKSAYSRRIMNLSVSKDQYGLKALGESAFLAPLLSNIYFNVYYPGFAYADRLYYDFDNEKGRESNGALLLLAARPLVLTLLDSLGYSVFLNDDPSSVSTFDYRSKGYLNLAAGSVLLGNLFDFLLPSEEDQIADGFLSSFEKEFPQNVFSSKYADHYELSLQIDGDESFSKIASFFSSNIPSDWSYKLNEEVTVTKKEIVFVLTYLEENAQLHNFSYKLAYNEKELISSALEADLSLNPAIFEGQGVEESSGITIKNIKLNEEKSYFIYKETSEDVNPETLIDNLSSFLGLPSKEKLSDPKIYPFQALPPRK